VVHAELEVLQDKWVEVKTVLWVLGGPWAKKTGYPL
jgi:hypothetical protein